jgi:hypothetical protein
MTFGIEDTFMKKKILLSLIWAIAFQVIYFLASMLMLAALGLAGFDKASPPREHSVGWYAFGITAGTWAWLFWASPVIGFALAFFGRLPGTRRKPRETPV